jgi:hypothetical protein
MIFKPSAASLSWPGGANLTRGCGAVNPPERRGRRQERALRAGQVQVTLAGAPFEPLSLALNPIVTELPGLIVPS